MSWFSKYSYYLVSYTFQGTENRSFNGNGHMVIRSVDPPTIDSLTADLVSGSDKIDQEISLVIVTYQRLSKKEYKALLSPNNEQYKKDGETETEIKEEI
jgi:hypothetical protein